MAKQTKITKEDVLQVADQLGFQPTIEEIEQVLEMYPSEQKVDPTGTWDLVVEHCLSTLGVEQLSPKQIIIDKVIEKIKLDVFEGDLTAVDELLQYLQVKQLKGYLAED